MESSSNQDHPGQAWTILKLLNWTTPFFEKHGSASARLDAEVLLADLLSLDRVQLYTSFDRPVSNEELAAFKQRVKRRAAGEPVAYILGYKGFWNFDLKVDSRALIPRPETELLVELALQLLASNTDSQSVVDVGTGSGAIALALAHENEKLDMLALDTSLKALDLARENAALLNLEQRVSFLQSDLLESVPQELLPLDMVISNPPYIAQRERTKIMKDVSEFEPSQALFSGDDGLDCIRRLIPQAHRALREGGYFLCEIGYDQGQAVQDLMRQHGFGDVTIKRDYAQLDRIVFGRRHQPGDMQ